jgi:hypothetical protein
MLAHTLSSPRNTGSATPAGVQAGTLECFLWNQHAALLGLEVSRGGGKKKRAIANPLVKVDPNNGFDSPLPETATVNSGHSICHPQSRFFTENR